MNKHRTYRSRGRVYCMDSGTVPHPSDVRGELVRGQFNRARCSCCEREVALLRNGCLSHHGPNPERKAALRPDPPASPIHLHRRGPRRA